jgi:DNA-binding Xre family transcriptional regulator
MMTRLRIAEIAESKGYNISTLSREAKLAYTTAHAMWHGSAKLLSMKTLERLALVLEVEVKDLFDGKPDPRSLEDDR